MVIRNAFINRSVELSERDMTILGLVLSLVSLASQPYFSRARRIAGEGRDSTRETTSAFRGRGRGGGLLRAHARIFRRSYTIVASIVRALCHGGDINACHIAQVAHWTLIIVLYYMCHSSKHHRIKVPPPLLCFDIWAGEGWDSVFVACSVHCQLSDSIGLYRHRGTALVLSNLRPVCGEVYGGGPRFFFTRFVFALTGELRLNRDWKTCIH